MLAPNSVNSLQAKAPSTQIGAYSILARYIPSAHVNHIHDRWGLWLQKWNPKWQLAWRLRLTPAVSSRRGGGQVQCPDLCQAHRRAAHRDPNLQPKRIDLARANLTILAFSARAGLTQHHPASPQLRRLMRQFTRRVRKRACSATVQRKAVQGASALCKRERQSKVVSAPIQAVRSACQRLGCSRAKRRLKQLDGIRGSEQATRG